jgi:hypothetical protein
VGDKNSNLDVSDIYCISKESLDMMADLGYGIKTKYWDK